MSNYIIILFEVIIINALCSLCVILHHTLGLEGGIRPVILPADIAGRFQNLASSNTRKDIETCGILSGKLVCSYFLNINHFFHSWSEFLFQL